MKRGSGKEILIRCKGSRVVSYSKLKAFQGGLKKMGKEDFESLKGQILKHGWVAPVFVWAGHDEILDGHGRLFVLEELLKEGYTIGDLPVADIEAKDRKEAAQILLAINSRYQKIVGEGLYNFGKEMGFDISDFEGMSLPEIDLGKFKKDFFGEASEGESKEDSVVPKKDPNVLVRVSFHPGLWLGKREEIMVVLEKLKKTYDCQYKVEE